MRGALLNLPFDQQKSAVAYGIAFCIGVAFVILVYPLQFLAGHGAYFDNGDASQHVAGWLFYAQDSWHFPLLRTERLNYPGGVSIAFTDSIPLAAVLFKPFVALLPAGFHYLGWWHAIVFVTQALGAAFLIRSLGCRGYFATILAVGFAVTWPTVLWRMGHTALMTHGVILCALGLYFRVRNGDASANRSTVAFIVLSIVALMIHPYLLALCLIIFLALLGDQAISGDGWGRQFLRLLACFVSVLVTCAVLGYLGNIGFASGFGHFSMNLLAPFCSSEFFNCVSDASNRSFGGVHYVDATGGQYEGFNYVGLGVLLLAPVAAVTRWRDLGRLPLRYPALLSALVVCLVYALSNKVYFATTEVLSYPLPAIADRIIGTFRASGRFFWPVGYCIAFVILAALLKKKSAGVTLLLLVALALQWADTRSMRAQVTETAAKPGVPDLAPWAGALANVDIIHLYPAFDCGGDDATLYQFFQRAAARYGKLLDNGYVARPTSGCSADVQRFQGSLAPRGLYVMAVADLQFGFKVPAAFRRAIDNGQCVVHGAALLCRSDLDRTGWQNTGLPNLAPARFNASIKAQWSADQLLSKVGKHEGAALVSTGSSEQGFLSFGPYIKLPAGRYRAELAYASNEPPTSALGNWDVVIGNGNTEPLVLLREKLTGTSGMPARPSGVVDIRTENERVEIRTFYDGRGDIRVMGVALEKIE